jgi:hypothetical protein
MQDMCMPFICRHGVLGITCILLTGILLVSTGLYSSNPQVQLALIDEMRPPLQEMLSRMVANRQWQDNTLKEYQAHRRFHASNPRFNMDSTLDVLTIFRWPHALQSTILRQEGSDFIREHVFEKILQAETELAENDQADIIPKNYDFVFAGREDCQGRPCWRLNIKPKRKDRYLLDGDIWVDTADYAISRVHGVPSKHVSIWVSRAEIDRRLCRIDGAWLTDRIESSSNIRLAGDVRLEIDYTYDNVRVENARPCETCTAPKNLTGSRE